MAWRTREATEWEEFPPQDSSPPGPEPRPLESTNTETLLVSAPSTFHATQVYRPGGGGREKDRERDTKQVSRLLYSHTIAIMVAMTTAGTSV